MSQLIDEVAASYDRWSRTYETDENATRDLAACLLRREFPDFGQRDVLEIGCGTGLNTEHLAGSSRSVVAFDFSAGMLSLARAKVAAQHVHFAHQDLKRRWNLAEDAVDLIVCMLVLEHLEDLNHILSEASRVLRRDGEFYICELHPYRQLKGVQARFTEVGAEKVTLVPAFLHDISEYVNAGINHHFKLQRMGEWRDGDGGGEGKLAAKRAEPPRLLSIRLQCSKKRV